jgi:hypothetical protein
MGCADASAMERRRQQHAIAARIAKPVQVAPVRDATAGEEPLRWKPTAERLEQAQVHPTGGTDPTHIDHQQRSCACRDGPGGDVQGGTLAALVGGVKNGTAVVEVETEDHALLPRGGDDGLEVLHAPKRLESDDHTAHAYRQNVERGACAGNARVHHQGAGGGGPRQLLVETRTHCATLDRIEVGHVAFACAQDVAVRRDERDRITAATGGQLRLDRRVSHAVPRPGLHGSAVHQIKHRDEHHDPF